FPGRSSASIAITPLKVGNAIINASYNGISRQVNVPVGTSAYTLSMFGSNRYVVGAAGQLSVQTGSSTPITVSLTSSDPSVVTVPSSLVVTSSEVAPLSALHGGSATITASANGASANYLISVVTSVGVQQFGPSFSVPINGTLN